MERQVEVEQGTFVFSYGSNLDSGRMRDRVGSAEVVGVSILPLHSLRFHKRSSRDGTGKANAFLTDLASDVVHGVVYRIDPAELAELDRIEGKGYGYDRHRKPFHLVVDGHTVMLEAWVYIAEPEYVDDKLRPLPSYLEHVIRGAKEHGLPEEVIKGLEEIDTTG